MSDVVDRDTFNWERGRRSFLNGAPWPKDDWADRTARAIWLGYHQERFRQFFEKRRVKALLGVQDD